MYLCLLFRVNLSFGLSVQIRKCAAAEWEEAALSDERVCVSACASSELMGHDKWKNNQCALASGFISMLPLSGPAAAENRQNQHHLAKPEQILTAQSGSCQSQDPLPSPHTHMHVHTHKHCGGVKGHKRHRLVLAVVAESQCCRRGRFRGTFFYLTAQWHSKLPAWMFAQDAVWCFCWLEEGLLDWFPQELERQQEKMWSIFVRAVFF